MRDYPEAYIQVEETSEGEDMFVYFNGKKIAQRGYPGTPQAKTWVSLEPGYVVRDGKKRRDGGHELVIEYDDVSAQ